jgi:hypothetical protein
MSDKSPSWKARLGSEKLGIFGGCFSVNYGNAAGTTVLPLSAQPLHHNNTIVTKRVNRQSCAESYSAAFSTSKIYMQLLCAVI